MQDYGQSSRKAAAKFKIAAACTVSRWARIYRENGIMALHDKPRGRPMKSGKKIPLVRWTNSVCHFTGRKYA
ncbi:MAG: helix-turn-helix domain-containing protein [Yersinia sp. (in: enterobacteria)]